MTLLVYGILSENTVNLNHIAESLPYWAQNSSLYKRFVRFFNKRMDLRGIGLFLLERFISLLSQNFKKKKLKIYLIIDRHEWHYGQKVNNLLTLMVYEPKTRLGVPIQAIDLDSRGNSSVLNRGLLLDEICSKLKKLIEKGVKLEIELLGDREFVGGRWKEYIRKNLSSYVLRIKRNYKIDDKRTVGDIYEEMKAGEIREFVMDNERLVIKKLELREDRRDDCLALVTTDKVSNAEEIIKRYRERWRIERMFFNVESNGFDLSKTHFKDSSKLEMLFYLVSICYYLSEIAGKIGEKVVDIGRKSAFLSGLRKLKRKLRGLLVKDVEDLWFLLREYEKGLKKKLVVIFAGGGVQY